MKRFISMILFASVFFIGLGTLIEKAGAKFKSDEKALALIRAARQAIGGDSAVGAIQSLQIVGQTSQNISVNGTNKTEQGQTEIALQLPDKLMKTIKIGHDDGNGNTRVTQRKVDVVVVDGKTKASATETGDDNELEATVTADGAGEKNGVVKVINSTDGKKIVVQKVDGTQNFQWKTVPDGAPDQNGNITFARTGRGEPHPFELLRLTLGLLLSTPKGMDVDYTYGGETNVDGTACNVVIANLEGSATKLFLNKDTNLPVMISYTGIQMPKTMRFEIKGDKPAEGDQAREVFLVKTVGPEGDDAAVGATAEFQIRFSDYRGVNGVQLPFRWTTSVNGAVDETLDITSYDVNPPDIASKFQNNNVVLLRTKKPSEK